MYLLGLIAQQIVSGEKSKSLPERIYSEFGLLDKCIFQKHQMSKKKRHLFCVLVGTKINKPV